MRYVVFKHAGVSSREEPQEDYYGTRMRNATLNISFPQEFSMKESSVIAEALQNKLNEMSDQEMIPVSVLCRDPLVNENDLSAFSAGFEVDQGNIKNVQLASSDEETVSDLELVSTLEEQVEIMNQKVLSQINQMKKKKIEAYREDIDELTEMTNIDIMGRSSGVAESIGFVKVELSKAEIETIAQYENIVQTIDVQSEADNDLDSAYTETKMDQAHHVEHDSARQTGSGVNVYMSEADNNCFDPNTYNFGTWIPGYIPDVASTGRYWEDRPTSDHATQVAQSLVVTAPHITLYCSTKSYLFSRSLKDRIHIINYSWTDPGYEGGAANTTSWLPQDSLSDRYVWRDRIAIFKSAGNNCNIPEGHCQVTSPGKAHNVITVGAYDDRTDRMGTFSRTVDPETNAIKPEIVAPGVSLRFPASVNASEVTSWNNHLLSGTSYSTPLAAGMAASVTSRYTLLKKQPHLIKASMLAMSAKDIQSGTSADGVGAIQWNEDGNYRYWSNYNNNFLVTGGWKLIHEYNVYRNNKKVRVVISWLNDVNKCDSSTAKLCMDIDLKVHGPNNEYIDHDYRNSHDDEYAPNNITNNNWRMVEFTTRKTGKYKVYVWRRSNWHTKTKRCFLWICWGHKKHYSKVNLGLRIAYIDYD